jgi:hypothetical protein
MLRNLVAASSFLDLYMFPLVTNKIPHMKQLLTIFHSIGEFHFIDKSKEVSGSNLAQTIDTKIEQTKRIK